MNTFIEFCKNQHDIVCNQKYDNRHPYSFHLEMVASQANKFRNFIPKQEGENYLNVIMACWGHDLIEDARVTYNDVKQLSSSETVANIIYCCTEEKGKNRSERHNNKYFKELRQNELAVFVKLCDIIANVKYSLLTNSSMYEKYKKEFPKLQEELHMKKYNEMFVYLEKLLNV